MGIFKQERQWIGHFLLLRKINGSRRRNRSVFNYHTAKSVALLFDGSENENHDLCRKYAKYMKEFGVKHVKSIAYFNLATPPEYFHPSSELECITKKDLNWFYMPVSHAAKRFVEEDFDILINTSLENSFPLYCLSALSRAKFKVGEYSDAVKECFDMMINSGNIRDTKTFLRNIDHYLKSINQPVV